MLLNLVNNAIKFTDQGEVLVSVDGLCQAQQKVELQFSVSRIAARDRISPRATARSVPLLQPGRPIDHAPLRWHRIGAGDQQEAGRSHGREHRREQRARPGQRLLLYRAARTRRRRRADDRRVRAQALPTRALIIDDNASVREVLSELMAAWAIDVVAVDSPDAAIERLEQAGNGGLALILIDSRMPATDVAQAVRRIRASLTGCHPRADQRVDLRSGGERFDAGAGAGCRCSLAKPV